MREFINVLLFGSIWGFAEATLGGLLHHAMVPYTGMIMSSVGFSILYMAMRHGVAPSRLFAISLIAASFKFFDSWLFMMPLLDRHIVNPATAIACQGLAFAVVFRRSFDAEATFATAAKMFAACAASTVAFNAISAGLYGWQTTQTANVLNTVLIQLPASTIIATAISKAYDALSRRIDIAVTLYSKVAGACCLAALAVIIRTIIG
jgi:hypothetical protein